MVARGLFIQPRMSDDIRSIEYVISSHTSRTLCARVQSERATQFKLNMRIDVTLMCHQRRFVDVNIFKPEFYYQKCSTKIVGEQAQRQSDRHLQRKERQRSRIFKPFASTQDACIKLISRMKQSLIIYICLSFTLYFLGGVCVCQSVRIRTITQYPEHSVYNICLNKFSFSHLPMRECVCVFVGMFAFYKNIFFT